MVTSTPRIENLPEDIYSPEVRRQQLDKVRQAGIEALRPKSTKRISKWTQENIHLPVETEGRPTKYDLTHWPFWERLFEAIHDPEVERIYIPKSTQVGGTAACVAALVALSELSPSPMMMVAPNQQAVTELRDRVYQWAKYCPPTAERVPREKDWNGRHVDLGTCRIYLAYSGGRQSLRGRPCRVVYMTETDVYKKGDAAGDAFTAARERVKAFYRRKIIAESSPAGEDSTITRAYEQSNKLRWHGKCPHCGTYQLLRFFCYRSGDLRGRGGVAGYRDAAGNLLEDDEARESAHYVCVRGCEIHQNRKAEFIENGVWVAAGQKVSKCGRKIVGKPTRSKRITGLHVWSIMSPRISFADLASAYIEKYHDGAIPEFWTDWLGLKYESPHKFPKWNILGRRLRGDHGRGEVHPAAWFLTAGADVQEDRVYFTVRGWGDGGTSWHVEWNTLHRFGEEGDSDDDITVPVASDLGQLVDAVLDKRWPVIGGRENPLGRKDLGVSLLNIDSNFRPAAVHEWWLTLPPRTRRRVRLVRGDHNVNPRNLFRRNVVRRNREGKEYKSGGMHQWGIFVDILKERLAGKFTAPRGAPGMFWLTRDVLIHGKEYLQQMVNEPRTITINKDGRRKVSWTPVSHRIGQDYWDAEVYAMAGAEMIVRNFPGTPGWQSSKWPTGRQADPVVFVPPAIASGRNVSVMR